jgi:putative oxidoreductase
MSKTTTTTTSTRVDAALALLRLAVGATFVAHGAQKLFVYGLAGVTAAFTQMGIPLPGITAPLVAFLELVGGLAIILGVFTRLAAVGLAINMLGAVALVHLKNGFFLPNGAEFALMLLAASGALALTGAGRYAIARLFSNSSENQVDQPRPAVRQAA